MKRYVLIVVAALAAASLACSSITINVPRLKTGPTETLTVSEPLPDQNNPVDVTIRMGAGSLTLVGGAEGLVEGEIQYNVEEWKPTVENDNGDVTIEQGRPEDNLGVTTGDDIVNDWNLKLGDAPMNLTVQAGAYKGTLDLTGVPLHRLSIADGASNSTVKFDEANPEEMTELRYETGASTVKLSGLANANFDEMTFRGGAGDYSLDFSGELQRDADVNIASGISSMRITVQEGMNVKVTVAGGLKDVKTEGTWTARGDTYETEGSGSLLTIRVDMAVGTLWLIGK